MSAKDPERLRVALLAGGLGHGGAEKQLVLMARALLTAGAEVRVYCVTRGEHHEAVLGALGLPPVWVGGPASPALRAAALTAACAGMGPHVVQATHTFMSLYAGVVGRALGALSLGALRSSLEHSRATNGPWTPWLMRAPHGVVVNSRRAAAELAASGLVTPGRIFELPNAIDLSAFSLAPGRAVAVPGLEGPAVAFVGRAVPVKRLDRFLRAVALARRQVPELQGLVVGDGPELAPMRALAGELGLLPGGALFVGARPDVPALLHRSIALLSTSDDEGLPNVLIEAMAARLPVVATPAGDTAALVRHGETGYLADPDDLEAMAAHLVALARDPALRRRLGEAGHGQVMDTYNVTRLPARLMRLYHQAAAGSQCGRAARALARAGC